MKLKPMFDSVYYTNRRTKLGQRQQQNLQKLNNAAYDYVNAQNDLAEQMNELDAREKESESKKEKKEEKKVEKKA